jgi:hypothetical protein
LLPRASDVHRRPGRGAEQIREDLLQLLPLLPVHIVGVEDRRAALLALHVADGVDRLLEPPQRIGVGQVLGDGALLDQEVPADAVGEGLGIRVGLAAGQGGCRDREAEQSPDLEERASSHA